MSQSVISWTPCNFWHIFQLISLLASLYALQKILASLSSFNHLWNRSQVDIDQDHYTSPSSESRNLEQEWEVAWSEKQWLSLHMIFQLNASLLWRRLNHIQRHDGIVWWNSMSHRWTNKLQWVASYELEARVHVWLSTDLDVFHAYFLNEAQNLKRPGHLSWWLGFL